ncbi:DUF222 domain-containing protein [Pseudarthrobacter sp. BRE9]|uniref:HNH endonuclease signature motif containing protein n=1 Tax=Pseudarthrobacter sp. BRE9 TaxID=2962582 RepID=UPI002882C54C|nr:DUF222 domain-containing protein [Pseudarthrobacter sp. BRE9]MDT0169374.1 DUF222 domain-containing protein [Pseudarthrobacter sp. BRE9]
MGKAAVVKALDEINAALAALNAEVDGCGSEPFSVADPLAGLGDGCLDILAGARAVEAGIAALKARAAVKYTDTAQAIAGPDVPVQALEMAVAAEIGALLALGSRAAGAFLAASHAVTKERQLTLSALQSGTITWPHALVMVEETATLDPAGAAALEAQFLDPDVPRPPTAAPIGQLPAYRFKAKARNWRERHHAESIEKRHAKGVADRRVEYRPDQDGMAWLSACLPADQAMAGWNRLTALARGMQGPDESRTLTQLKADNFTEAILGRGNDSGRAGAGGDGADAAAGPSLGIRAQVLVTVPVFSLLGLTDEPAMLDGYGPIPPSMARELVANGGSSFYRVLVDPRDGAPLEIGRTSYRVTKAMKRALQFRDGRCTFPGCNNPSLDNEADHLQAWKDGGSTGISNLVQLCPKHHRLKHATSWEATPATKTGPPGWISPTGRTYKAENHDWEPPLWPQQLAPPWKGAGRSESLPVDPPDFVYIGLSPGEDALERFLHAPPA